jgi:hypothetical protein
MIITLVNSPIKTSSKMRKIFYELIKILKIFFLLIKSLIKSDNIYFNILKHYNGYGLKFTSLLIFFTTLISIFGIFINIQIFENNLQKIHTDNISRLDYIVNQFPEIHYDGKTISFENDDKPILIKNSQNDIIFAFDINNILKITEKSKTIAVFKKSELSFFKIPYVKSLNYKNIFGTKVRTINHEDLKIFILQSIDSAKANIIFSTPLIFLLTFIDYIVENSIVIFFVFILCKLLHINVTIKDITRTILFAAAPSALLSSILLFTIPSLLFLSSALRLFCLFSVYRTLAKIFYNKS